MASTNIRYVDPNSTTGGDGTTNALSGAARAYVSLSAWEAARQADLVTGDIIERVICSSDDAGATHAADTTAFTITGWTTDATRYIQIESASSHGGKWNANIYRLEVTNLHGLQFTEDYGYINGIQTKLTITDHATTRSAFRITGGATSGIILSRCIALGVISGTNTASAVGYNYNGGTASSRNCVAYDFINGAETHYGWFMAAGSVYNGTAYNCNVGYARSAGTPVATNCGAAACTTAFSATITQTTCSSSTPTFINEGADDFHLASNDTTWIGQGTDLSAIFTVDIDGETRPTGAGTWDIGADEYVSSSTAHSYTGGVGDGAITRNAGTQRTRGIVRSLGGSKVYGAGTVKARGKIPSVGGAFSLNAATVRARGKVPMSGGTRVFNAASVITRANLYLYVGGGSQVYDSATQKARGKVPAVGGAFVHSAASIYAAVASRAYSYVGEGVLVLDSGATHSLGKVYVGGGAFHFESGSIYSKTAGAGATAYSYTGLASGSIVFGAATLVLFDKCYIESLPITVWSLEGKPLGSYTAETIPSRPAAQDGAYTDPTQDGVWDEYPVDG
ncbi:MAG: hypothetical protein NUV51_10010, partial [Sulfuricaulis sp.]|nr:hypothetical protein [Sulfuricaulis sp.]